MIPAPSPLLVGLAIGASTVAPLVALVWALLVDRDSLRGAVDRPDDSVEGAWYDRAAQGAFSDTILAVGLATAALAITGLRIDVVVALVGVLLVAMGSCGIRYLVARRRGGRAERPACAAPGARLVAAAARRGARRLALDRHLAGRLGVIGAT